MKVGARIVLGWIEGRLETAWSGEPEDLVDWLAGNDDAIAGRQRDRDMAVLAAAGAEVG